MCAKVLHKLDALRLLLPEFYMPVDTSCDHIICLCDDDVGHQIAMHVAQLVLLPNKKIFVSTFTQNGERKMRKILRAREGIQIELLELHI
jgi:hypothetical protein